MIDKQTLKLRCSEAIDQNRDAILAFAEDISATTEAGMNAHISKPIDFDIFKKTLKKLSSGTA